MAGVLATLSGAPTEAAQTPEAGLNTCQNTIRIQGTAFAQGYAKAVDACLQRISTEVIGKGGGDIARAAATCVAKFRKLHDSRGAGKSLPEKLQAKIGIACDPTGNSFTLADILGGGGASVAEPMNAQSMNEYCRTLGGDGSIDSLSELIDCVQASQTCAATAAIAGQYPRAIEWLTAVETQMSWLSSPPTDLYKVPDALAALEDVKAALDGPAADGQISPACVTSTNSMVLTLVPAYADANVVCGGSVSWGSATNICPYSPGFADTQDTQTTKPACTNPTLLSSLLRLGPSGLGKVTLTPSFFFDPVFQIRDILINVAIQDVRNASDNSAYTGSVTVTGTVRGTELPGCDPNSSTDCTLVDFALDELHVPCTAGTCAATASADNIYCSLHDCSFLTGGILGLPPGFSEILTLKVLDQNNQEFLKPGLTLR